MISLCNMEKGGDQDTHVMRERERESFSSIPLVTCTRCLKVHFTPTYRPERCDIFYPAVKAPAETSVFCENLSFFTLFTTPSEALLNGVRCSERVGGHLFPARSPFAQSPRFVSAVMSMLAADWIWDFGVNALVILGEDFKARTHRVTFVCYLWVFFKIPPAQCFPQSDSLLVMLNFI